MSGLLRDESGVEMHKIKLVHSDHLEGIYYICEKLTSFTETKKQFHELISSHVYSVERMPHVSVDAIIAPIRDPAFRSREVQVRYCERNYYYMVDEIDRLYYLLFINNFIYSFVSMYIAYRCCIVDIPMCISLIHDNTFL